MRYIERSASSRPAVYDHPDVLRYREEVAQFLNAGIKDERPPRVPEMLYRSTELRNRLHSLFSGACAYCETDLATTPYSVDFYRPIAGAADNSGKVDFQYYCWLATEWENSYVVCNACSRFKGNLFPVDTRGPASANISELRSVETPLLLDPCWNLPTAHLKADNTGLLYPISDAGEATISFLNLNRPELVERRTEAIDGFRHAIWSGDIDDVNDIDRIFFREARSSFRGVILIYLLSIMGDGRSQRYRNVHLSVRQRVDLLSEVILHADRYLGDMPGTPALGKPRFERSVEFNRYVRSIEIENFRGIETAFIEFPERRDHFSSSPGSIALLGDNGAGKSTVLQAAAIGCLGHRNANAMNITSEWCLRTGETRGKIIVRFFDTDDFNIVEFLREATRLDGLAAVEVMVLGYGAYRLPARRSLTQRRRKYRVASLFDERELVNGSFGLRKHLNTGDRQGDAVRTLNALLGDQARAEISSDGKLSIKQNKFDRPLRDLSSGYKSIVTLATDIMDVMYEVWDGATSGQALILIDEIDAHLHPAWRQRIVEVLRETFPRAQFLMTTHDPLVLRGLQRAEIATLESEADRVSIKMATEVPIEGLSIDQLLTSELFGLASTENLARTQSLERYYSILSKPDLTDAEKNELAALKGTLGPTVPIGTTRRERLLLAVVDAYLDKTDDELVGDAWNTDVIGDLLSEFELAERALAE